MFRLVKYFIKQTLIAFFVKNEKYILQKQIVKNDKILEKTEFEFNEEEFIIFLKSCFIENTQTYVSTIIDTFNQGVVDSCSHSKYKELGINLDNIKILCLKDYSIFIGLYELNTFQKEMKKFNVDFIFSPYLLIDIHKSKTKNSIYILITDSFVVVLIYEDGIKPKYSNIYQFKIDEENTLENDSVDDTLSEDIENIDLVDDIEELDDIEDLDEDIESSLDDMDEVNIDNNENIDDIVEVKNEIETLDFIKNSIKDYYENYSDNFLEYGYLFYDTEISNKLISNIENETFLEIKSEKIDILSAINELALKEIDV